MGDPMDFHRIIAIHLLINRTYKNAVVLNLEQLSNITFKRSSTQQQEFRC